MTTESKQVSTAARAGTGVGTLLGTAAGALAAGFVVAVAASAVAGGGAAYAAAGVALAAALVMALGALLVNAVAALMPAASLLLALLTYAFQLTVLTVVLAAVARASGDTVTAWAAGALIAVTLVWTVGHIVLTTRRRIPVYDLPVQPPLASGSDGVSEAPGAGAR